MKSTFKKISWVILFSLSFSFSMTGQETGKIYFLRSTSFITSASAFKTFIDSKFVCKLNNKKYSIHEVPVGKHVCSVQIEGKKPKESAEQFEVEVKAGEITYVQIIFEWGFFGNNVFCEGITEKLAIQRMKEIKEDTECL